MKTRRIRSFDERQAQAVHVRFDEVYPPRPRAKISFGLWLVKLLIVALKVLLAIPYILIVGIFQIWREPPQDRPAPWDPERDPDLTMFPSTRNPWADIAPGQQIGSLDHDAWVQSRGDSWMDD